MSMTCEQIEACPFCGEKKDFGIGRGTEDREGYPTWVYCGKCGAQGPWVYIRTEDTAYFTTTSLAAGRTGWNRRSAVITARKTKEACK